MKTCKLTKKQAEILSSAVQVARKDKDFIHSMIAGYDWFFRLACAWFAGYLEGSDIPFAVVYGTVKALCDEVWNIFRAGQKTKEVRA